MIQTTVKTHEERSWRAHLRERGRTLMCQLAPDMQFFDIWNEVYNHDAGLLLQCVRCSSPGGAERGWILLLGGGRDDTLPWQHSANYTCRELLRLTRTFIYNS